MLQELKIPFNNNDNSYVEIKMKNNAGIGPGPELITVFLITGILGSAMVSNDNRINME